jgi:hypothetical protein
MDITKHAQLVETQVNKSKRLYFTTMFGSALLFAALVIAAAQCNVALALCVPCLLALQLRQILHWHDLRVESRVLKNLSLE